MALKRYGVRVPAAPPQISRTDREGYSIFLRGSSMPPLNYVLRSRYVDFMTKVRQRLLLGECKRYIWDSAVDCTGK